MRRIKPLIKQNLSSFSPPVHPQPPTDHPLHFARNIVVLLGVVFFLCGLLHFLVRYLMKKKRSSSSSSNSLHQSSRFQESTPNDDDDDDDVVYERQLQQLFHLHDSGLDQAFIDALPVFLYKELIMGLKNEPFDCAVCLCEFSQLDNLRLLPLCSHAFHIHCIDTWLLSNSTCPLCRGTLFTPGFSVETPVFFDDSIEEDDHDHHVFLNSGMIHDDGVSGNFKQSVEKRVYPVRLGKFRATNGEKREEKKEVGETSSSNLDARRCYSMGSYEYVVGNSELQVRFCPSSSRGNIGKKDVGIEKDTVDGGSDGKKISSRTKGESFSVSKIWLWSKKDQHKFQDSSSGSTTHMMNSSVNVSLPSRNSNVGK
ncbi:hypothetical protein L6452_17679 [Arctium lappa]|uniref:Uncharacterized protein n=1 Tax=Arctium lappa TaxID=4217 RepID=A0ACB9C4C3_ARCLA|nr:hypothetical protein L6452_17679 [Arctium lappa]